MKVIKLRALRNFDTSNIGFQSAGAEFSATENLAEQLIKEGFAELAETAETVAAPVALAEAMTTVLTAAKGATAGVKEEKGAYLTKETK